MSQENNLSKYALLDAELRRAGFWTNGVECRGGWNRTTVCSKGFANGAVLGGNSSWVTRLPTGWFIGTWGGLIYRLPDASRIASFCIKWLERYPDDVRTAFDEDVATEFGLIEVSDQEFESVAGDSIDFE